MTEFKTVRELYETCKFGDDLEKESLDGVEFDGWIRTNRNNGSIGFIELNDGTYFRNAQIVYDASQIENFDVISHFRTGASIHVEGKFVLTPEMKQPFEVHLTKAELLGDVMDGYPLQKKRHGFEFLREIAHLRPRANTFNAVYRVRSVLSMNFSNHKVSFMSILRLLRVMMQKEQEKPSVLSPKIKIQMHSLAVLQVFLSLDNYK